jgi:hypothetical protein
MEVSDLRRRIRAAIEAARLRAADRRARTDGATRAYEQFLEAIGVPAFHTMANALVGEGHRFKVTTPGQAARLTSERSADDFIEMSLDTNRDVAAADGWSAWSAFSARIRTSPRSPKKTSSRRCSRSSCR